jgi:hypothetical protein
MFFRKMKLTTMCPPEDFRSIIDENIEILYFIKDSPRIRVNKTYIRNNSSRIRGNKHTQGIIHQNQGEFK